MFLLDVDGDDSGNLRSKWFHVKENYSRVCEYTKTAFGKFFTGVSKKVDAELLLDIFLD